MIPLRKRRKEHGALVLALVTIASQVINSAAGPTDANSLLEVANVG